ARDVFFQGPRRVLPGPVTCSSRARDVFFRGPRRVLPGPETCSSRARDVFFQGPRRVLPGWEGRPASGPSVERRSRLTLTPDAEMEDAHVLIVQHADEVALGV
ncbi:hypothetical protein CRUP_024102, partial [Coryphaenoides rupestris]